MSVKAAVISSLIILLLLFSIKKLLFREQYT